MKIKSIILMFTLLTIATALSGLFMYYYSIKTAALKEDQIVSESHTKATDNAISQMISHYHQIALSLSQHRELTLALTESSETNLERANQILDLYNSSMQTGVCYLLNINGIAIASSNRKGTDSFVGKDYSFRPYFNNSIKGSAFVYMASGVTSGRRGIYFSTPVYAPDLNSIIGVSVIKEDVDKIETENFVLHYPTHVEHHDCLFIANEDGVIFISGQKELIFHTVWQIDENKIKATAATMQFGSGPWPWAGFTKINEEKVIDQSGRNYCLISEPLKDIPVWRIIHLSDSDAVIDRVHGSFFRTFGYVFLFVFIIIGSVLAILHSLADKAEKELRNAQNSLGASEHKWRTILLNTTQLGITLDLEARIVFANTHFLELTGWKEEEVIGQNWFDRFIPDNVREEVRKVFDTIISQKDSVEFSTYENEIMTKAGELRNVAWSNLITKDAQGITVDVTCLGIDLTERKQMEARIQQSQKMEAIGTLAGGIAHDFNNILFPIMGYTEMLLGQLPEDSPFQHSLNEIYTSANRAKELVRQILTFSRQETNELMLMKMQPIIKETLKLIRATIPTTVTIRQNINADCGAIKADPTQMHQIIMNLATNAYHAMGETGGELKVTLKEVELGQQELIHPDMAPGLYARLTVADTGIGMDKKLTEKIFEPFFTTKEKGKGTGMGLSVVHGIVRNAGGSIYVYSEPGKGSEFHVYLPIVKRDAKKTEYQRREPVQGGTETILLVDDEDVIIRMEKQMLERLGYKVTSLTSSIEALECFRAAPHKFDLIITDMAMPNMSGDKLAAEMIKIRPGSLILLCTGFSESMTEEKAASIGIKGFLMKPMVTKDLAQKIRDVLD